MRVVKKINNNVAVCIDGNGSELVAFGKGLGFPRMPYELSDLGKIDMTFYQLNAHYRQLLTEIPEGVFQASAEIVAKAREVLPRELNPNTVFSLADHINFAIIRLKDYQGVQLPFSYDIAQMFPAETQMGAYALTVIRNNLHVQLPKSEETAIAMHFVNSQAMDSEATHADPTEELINRSVRLIEKQFDIQIDRQSFTYNRFAMHLRYYIKRVHDQSQLTAGEVNDLFTTMQREEPIVYRCAQSIADLIDLENGTTGTTDEIFYLMVYVKRLVNNAQTKKEG
ncbi:PRD domain-containing protein [Schleiferilactobacillus harbinensis]|uniref:PRD domain-containing protein n=1 Tax=Schleiferilactobacillus harbinensis TaxID=304207 RepID=UPI00123902A2|nr:PRD domain-containing protein [Schleiferilactobacillus harbinensis]QEU47530.1 PRD domain-containing protein [Schleiferilactobacillus harbinensis]